MTRWTPSPEQQQILDWVRSGSGHAVVQATAGSGKTTTLEMISHILPEDITSQYCAFNKAIVEELEARLPRHMNVSTLHRLGMQVIRHFFPAERKHAINNSKYRAVLQRYFDENTLPGFCTREDRYQAFEYLLALQRVVRMTLTPLDDLLALQSLGVQYEIREPDSGQVTQWCLHQLGRVLKLGMQLLEEEHWVDFEDMLYVPVRLKLDYRQVDFLLVDEAQDLSPLQLQFALGLIHEGGRSIFVGDEHQAIYGFAGADTRSMQRIQEALQATVLPLSVSYRCPQLHVKLAQHLSPSIQARPKARVGQVRHINEKYFLKAVQEGDLVICRYNAPLASMYHELLQLGKRPRLRKGDFTDKLLDEFRSVFGDLPLDERSVLSRCQIYLNQERQKLRKKEKDAKVLNRKLSELQDRVDSVKHLARSALQQGHTTGEAAMAHLKQMVSVEHQHIVLSTVHSAKGLEAKRVFLLYPEKMAAIYAYSEEALRGEQCVQFVALTRAKDTLFLVEEPPHEKVEQVWR